MKVLVTGAKGQLGQDVVKYLEKEHEVIGVDLVDFDITVLKEAENFINRSKPEVIIHCAAYTAVDRAESDQEKCYAINVIGTQNLVSVAKDIGAKFLYISTDYVFDGEGEEPWQAEDSQDPVNYYGETKYLGEKAIMEQLDQYFILRISWVFGKGGNNFVKTMLKLSETRDELSVVNDQIGSPTFTEDLAVLIGEMIVSQNYGIYHGSNEGYCSWYEFASEIFSVAGVEMKLNPVDSAAFPTDAKRPKNSRMDKEKLTSNGFNRLPSWQSAVKRYLY